MDLPFCSYYRRYVLLHPLTFTGIKFPAGFHNNLSEGGHNNFSISDDYDQMQSVRK